MITRRNFLKNSMFCSSLAGTSLISLSGTVPQFLLKASRAAVNNVDRILVVVQLSGGNDGLNTVVPYGDDEYYRNRFTLALSRTDVIRIDDHVGLHPSLSGFGKLLDSGSLSVIQNVGYPQPNRSHFQSMDLWHTAHRKQSDIRLGWLGRFVEGPLAGESLPALHLGQEDQPLALASDSIAVPSIRSRERFRLHILQDQSINSQIDLLTRSPRPKLDELLNFVQENTNAAIAASRKLATIDQQAKSSVEYPRTALAEKMQSIGNLIGSGLQTRIYYVVLDGFDTHSNQAAAHQGLLQELGDAVAAFMNQLNEQGNQDRVCVMTFSEFGRRVRENASRGTDHGTAAPMFMVGNRVKSGLIGDYPDLSRLEDGDLQYTIDYRQVYSSVIENWLGAPSREILGNQFEKLALFEKGSGAENRE